MKEYDWREGSVFRWVPAGHYPAPACPHQVLIVELEGSDRGTPTGGLPGDQGAILAPTKVLAPGLAAWVEKRYSLTALRVSAVRLRPLVAVAQRTSQSEVFFCGRAASSLGDDMLYMHGHGRVRLRGQAIATPMAGLGGDPLS